MKSLFHRPLRAVERPAIEIASATAPMDVLRGQRIAVVADAQNLCLGARDLGFRLAWGALGRRLTHAAGQAYLHAVYACGSAGAASSNYFASRGWVPHPKSIRVVRRQSGWTRKSNADNSFAVIAGAVCRPAVIDLIVVGTGDGELAQDVAEAVRQFHERARVVTLSLAGSTAASLNARYSRLIDANIEIGLDCLCARQDGGAREQRRELAPAAGKWR